MSKLVPPVTLTIDDKPYTLVCDMAAIQALLDWTGVDLTAPRSTEEAEALGAAMSKPANINAMLAAMLLSENERITPRLAGRMIRNRTITALVSEKCMEAIGRFFEVSPEEMRQMAEKATAEEAAKGTQESASESPNSGQSPDTTSTSPTPNSGEAPSTN